MAKKTHRSAQEILEACCRMATEHGKQIGYDLLVEKENREKGEWFKAFKRGLERHG